MGTIPSIATYPTGGIFTSAYANSVKAAVDFWALTPRVSVYSNSTISVPSATTYTLFNTWDAEQFDVVQSGDSPMHDTVTNPERLVARTTGKYQLTGQVSFDVSATGIRGVMARLNSAGSPTGGTQLYVTNQGAVPGSFTTSVPLPVILVPMTAGDYIEIFVRQNSGGALNTVAGRSITFAFLKLDSQ